MDDGNEAYTGPTKWWLCNTRRSGVGRELPDEVGRAAASILDLAGWLFRPNRVPRLI